MVRKTVFVVMVTLSLMVLVLGSGCRKKEQEEPIVIPWEDAIVTEMRTISKETYYNKTLGGLIGQFVGFLSGYEFTAERVALPDHWYEFLNGPYAGNYTYHQPGYGYEESYDRLRFNDESGLWEVWSDDDYHIDIFNQKILDDSLPLFSSESILHAWRAHQVGDWGGGMDAMNIMNNTRLLPPFTGRPEHGNRFGWCTEAYIENETLGMNAPGMPLLALELVDRFGAVTGYFDSLIWAKFYGTLYSLAYFEDDIDVLLEHAAHALPNGSWPRRMYDIASDLHQEYPNDWRSAAIELEKSYRYVMGIDNLQTAPDVNGGFAILSWLYGDGDYMESVKISSLIGYDGDCTAAIVAGLLGVMHGLDPEAPEYEDINTYIYQDGEGVYVNDLVTGFPPRINRDYPVRQKITDIVSLYQSNFEQLLLEEGGSIDGETYTIPTTNLPGSRSITKANYDFEEGDLSNWVTQSSTNDKNIVRMNNSQGNVHSGDYSAQLYSSDVDGINRLYQVFKGLEPGEYYRVKASLKTSLGIEGRLFASSSEGETYVSVYDETKFVERDLVFQATSVTMHVGVQTGSNTPVGKFIVIDDMVVEKVSNNHVTSIELDRSGEVSDDLTFEIPTNPEREVILRIRYVNHDDRKILFSIYRNDAWVGNAYFNKTGPDNDRHVTVIEIPYRPHGDNEAVRLEFAGQTLSVLSIDLVETESYQFR